MRRSTKVLLSTLMGLGLAIGGVESWARLQPIPRVQQIFDHTDNDLQLVDGTPTWHGDYGHLERWNLDCAADRRADVMLLGSSIFYGVRLDGPMTLGALLADHLGSEDNPSCVVNLSQPGSAFKNQNASALLMGAKLNPRVVVWEIWHNSVNTFVVIGDSTFNFGQLQRDSGGIPNAFHLSADWNRRLFEWSAAYRYVDLSLAQKHSRRVAEVWAQFVDDTVQPALARLQANGSKVLLVYTPPLSRPFTQSTVPDDPGYLVMEQWAAKNGILTVDLARELGDADPDALGLDRCCHFNAEGTKRVAEILSDPVRSLLD